MVVGYATPGKEKSASILEAFCAGADRCGAGGRVVREAPPRLLAGAAAFYGVTPATQHLWLQARREQREWYYIDNAYFDKWRQVYFRVTRGALQHHGLGRSDGRRYARLGIQVRSWRAPGAGRHVLLCPQSDEFMRTCALRQGDWVSDTIAELKQHTRRELRVRPWNGNKKAWYATLPDDLANCWALVTYSSASAITALLEGIPAFCTALDCISGPVTERALSSIERPRYPVNRESWARVVADNQWTLDEMRSGLCWKMINE